MVKTKSGEDSKKHYKKNAGRDDDSNSSGEDDYVSKKQKLSGNQYKKSSNARGKRSSSGSRSSSVEEVGSRNRRNDKKLIGKRRGDDSDDSYDGKRKGQRSQREEGGRGPRQSHQYEAYVGSLSYNATEDDITSYFEECGKVDSVNVLKGRDGKPKGIAFVRFEDEESLNKALELNGKSMLGRNIVVEKSASKSSRDNNDSYKGGNRSGSYGDNNRESRDNSCTVYVGNLSFDTNSSSLEKFFKDCGKVTSARVISNDTGRSKGFGYVEFASQDDVKNAIGKNGEELDGRDIKVDYANSKPSGGRSNGSYGGGRGGGRGGRGGFRR